MQSKYARLVYNVIQCYTMLYSVNIYSVIQCNTMLYNVIQCLQCYTVLYSVIQCYTVLYSVIQCYAMLYNVIQCYTVLYSVIQCYTMLYNIIQCYTVLYNVSLLSPGVGMYVLNTEYFGHLLRPNTYSSLQEAANAFLNFKLQTLGRHIKVRSYLPVSLPVLHLGCCLWQYKWDGQYCRW